MNPQDLGESLKTLKWIDIGFQAEDPTTDFRGTGLLGLVNLLHFLRNYEAEALECLKTSRTPKLRAIVTAVAMPRALNEPVGFSASSLRNTVSIPSDGPTKRKGRSGVIPSPRVTGSPDPGRTSA